MAFTNTVDVLGDEALTAKILDGSLTELHDNIITSIGSYALCNMNELTDVELSELTLIRGGSVFSDSGKLRSVKLPKLVNIFGDAYGSKTYIFAYCSSLTLVDVPLLSICEEGMFYSCSALESIALPSVATVSNSVFANCTNLKKIYFEELLTINGSSVFTACNNLTEVIIANENNVVALTKSGLFNSATNAIVYVPDSLVEDYKSATNWSAYADRIKPLSELPAEEET